MPPGGAPEVVHLPVDPDVDFINMPAPVPKPAHPANPLPADIRGKHRAETIPPQPDRLMTEVDATLVEQILDVPR